MLGRLGRMAWLGRRLGRLGRRLGRLGRVVWASSLALRLVGMWELLRLLLLFAMWGLGWLRFLPVGRRLRSWASTGAGRGGPADRDAYPGYAASETGPSRANYHNAAYRNAATKVRIARLASCGQSWRPVRIASGRDPTVNAAYQPARAPTTVYAQNGRAPAGTGREKFQ